MKERSMSRIAKAALAGFAALALGLSACSTTPEAAPAPPPQRPDSEFDQGAVQEPSRSEPAPSSMDLASELRSIHFDFDRAEIRSDARPILRSNGEALRRARRSVVVEGHCDERGSEEYNLALGERRAHSVMKYLTNLGVSSSQLSIVSYGETRPVDRGRTEVSWARNRRAEFRVR